LNQLQAPAVPNLPLPKDDFSKQYLNQLTNVLRIFFNGDNATLTALINYLPENQVYTLATLPTGIGMGYRAFITDSSITTFNTIAASGGTNKVPVFYDGTNWRVG